MHLRIKNFCYKYPNNDLFHLQIPSAEYRFEENLGIYGLSGSGKTTLGKAMAGIFTTSAIDFSGANIFYSAQMAENILLGDSIQQTLKIISGKDKNTLVRRFSQILAKFGLQFQEIRNKQGFQLSFGELRKISLSLAMAYEGDILIMDEPSIGLDWYARIELIQQIQNYEKPMVIISHDYEMLKKLCNFLWVIDQGKLVFQGNFHQLENNGKLCDETGINYFKLLVEKRKKMLIL